MLTLSREYLTLISAFAPVFTKRIWQHPQVLLVGAILAPGKRTVTAALRMMGLSGGLHFQTYHRVIEPGSESHLLVSQWQAAAVHSLGADS
jgi:hypothetical protein